MPRLDSHPATISVELDGHPIPAREGEPLACAMLAAGESITSRSVKYHRPRGPFCFTGACAQCLVRVDGVPNLPACQVPARPGLRAERQNSFPTAKLDLFFATDWFFPKGLNHHELFAGVPVAEQVMAKVARQLAGLGTLPETAAPPRGPAKTLTCDALVVGGGISGLSAAKALAQANVKALVLERDPELGGRWRHGAEAQPQELGTLPQVATWTNVQAIGVFEDEHGRFVLAVEHPHGEDPRLFVVRAKAILFAQGGHPALLAFENNDLPNIFSARAVARMIHLHGFLPGKRFAVVGDRGEADAMASLLTRMGATIDAVGAEPIRAHGLNAVSAITVRADGVDQKIDCDAVVVCGRSSPMFELARQAGGKVVWRERTGVFAVEADSDGKVANGVWAAGELLGPCTQAESARSGRVAGAAIATSLAEGAR